MEPRVPSTVVAVMLLSFALFMCTLIYAVDDIGRGAMLWSWARPVGASSAQSPLGDDAF